jgi:hypothetical protein
VAAASTSVHRVGNAAVTLTVDGASAG